MSESRVVVVKASQTGRQALEQAGDALYLVIQFADGSFAAMKPADLRAKLNMWKILDKPLEEAPKNVLAPHRVETILEDAPDLEARRGALKAGQALAAVSAAGEFRMLLVAGQTFRGGGPHGEAGTKGLGTLSVGAGSTPRSAAPEQAPQKRYINVELKDSEEKHLDPKTKPLKKEDVYSLIFDVDVELRATAIATKGVEFVYQFQEGEQLVKMTVRLETEDFDLFGEQEKTLLVPRTGKSKNKASFLMQPLHDGECQVNAVFLKDGNFVQVIVLKFYVGEIFQATTLGRGVEAAFAVQPRDVSLTILRMADEFKLILISPGVAATATLPIKPMELQDIALQAREKLLAVVNFTQDKRAFYQAALDIPPEIDAQTSRQLAEVGFRLYQRIFFGPSADEQCKNLGRKLRELAQKEKLKIQIFSQEFVLPWGLLYMADRFDPNRVDVQLFLGLKHIIEHIPLQQSLLVTSSRMDASSGLTVGLNVNTDIDKQTRYPLVGKQLEYWQALKSDGAKVSLIKRTTASEVTGALSDGQGPDQVLYFYCHGLAQGVDDVGGVSASTLMLSGSSRITLDDLYMYAPTDDHFANTPLVFINACESAKLSPLIYDGFVPYFMAKGARGVIGTEVETPALFAIEWAKRFFDRFLKGESVGEIFLALRKEFYEQNRNLMGLLYALYVDGDTRLDPGVAA